MNTHRFFRQSFVCRSSVYYIPVRLSFGLAIAGLITAVLLFLLSVSPALAAGPPLVAAPIGYREALSQLQQSGVPLRLPKILVIPGAHGTYGATLDKADATGYSLTIGDRYPCGGTPCTKAVVEAIRRTDALPSLEQMFADVPPDPTNPDAIQPTRSSEAAGWVALPGGINAYYQPWVSYTFPGYAHLTWDEGDYRYDIAIKFGTLDGLMQMATSIFN